LHKSNDHLQFPRKPRLNRGNRRVVAQAPAYFNAISVLEEPNHPIVTSFRPFFLYRSSHTNLLDSTLIATIMSSSPYLERYRQLSTLDQQKNQLIEVRACLL
jgi:hypothetical protein